MEKFKILNADSKEQSEATSNEYIWKAVLSRAAEDAFLMSCNTLSAVRDVEQALHWFVRGGQDFDLVCEYAGRNPAYVYHKAITRYVPEIKEREKYLKVREKEIRKDLENEKIEKYNKKHKTYFLSLEAQKEHMLMKRKEKNNRTRKKLKIGGKRYESKELGNL